MSTASTQDSAKKPVRVGFRPSKRLHAESLTKLDDRMPHDHDADEDQLRRSISRRLREAVEAQTLTSTEIAKRIGCDNSTLSRWFDESNSRMPTAMLLARFCRVLGLSADYILQGEGAWVVDDEAFESIQKKGAAGEALRARFATLAVFVHSKTRLADIDTVEERIEVSDAILERAQKREKDGTNS